MSLESELLALLGGDHKAGIVARYWGLDGLGGATLQAAGVTSGITAERVRQIVSLVEDRLPAGRPPAPFLDRSLALISRQAPCWAADIEPKLQSEGLTDSPFRVDGVLRAAQLLGRTPTISVTETPRGRLVHAGTIESLDNIVRCARRLIERRGVATISDVAAEMREIEPRCADRKLITLVLVSVENLEPLGGTSGWFWLPAVPRNPMVRRIRKILAVSSRVRLPDLCAGVAREYRLQGFSPPAPVVLDLCRQIAGVQVEDDWICAAPEIELEEVLSDVELTIVSALLDNGGSMRRADLVALCQKRGLNRSSFYSSLSHSPVILSHTGGVMALVGTAVAPTLTTVSARRLARLRRPGRMKASR